MESSAPAGHLAAAPILDPRRWWALVFGAGIGPAFVTATVAALAGVAEHESGLASGLSNTALQIGAALGVAIVSTVAVSRSEDYMAANEGATRSSC